MTRATLIKKLDKLFSKIVRFKGYCEKCGRTTNLQCAHIYSRSNKNMRWDFENAVCLCASHHLFWGHKEPAEFIKWAGQFKDLNYLARKKAMSKPLKMADLENKLMELKNYKVFMGDGLGVGN